MLLVIQFLERYYAGLRVSVEIHLLTVLDAFTLPATIISFKLGDLRVPTLENLFHYLLRRHPVGARLIGLRGTERSKDSNERNCSYPLYVSPPCRLAANGYHSEWLQKKSPGEAGAFRELGGPHRHRC